MVSSTPNNTDSQFVTSLMSENSGNIKPTINPAKDSFDKSKKYPANFSRLASDFFRFSSFIFLTRSKLLSELLTPKGMSFGDTNTSSLFLLLPIIAF